jgi:hypothetical protein
MPAARAYAHPDEVDDAGSLSERTRPITLIDIARVLGESAKAERLGDIPIRAWRDDLTLIRDSLSYSRAVLAADVTILSQLGTTEAIGGPGVAGDLPGVLVADGPEDPWGEEATVGFDPEIDEGLFVRTDHLLAVHQEMARVDLSSPGSRGRVRELVEGQLAMLTERQAAVEARLQQIRAVIFRRYREGAASAHDRPA